MEKMMLETIVVAGAVKLIIVKKLRLGQHVFPRFWHLEAHLDPLYIISKSADGVMAIDVSGRNVAITEVTALCPELKSIT